MKRLFMAACFATLAACGADSDEREVVQKYREEMEAANASLIYSFPADGQEQVPTPSPVVLRFSSAVTDTAPDIRVRKKGGADLAIARIETPDSGRSMVLYPDGDLDPLTEYEVVIPAINLQKGTTEARTISFRTGALAEGAASQVGESTFRLVRTIPDNQGFDIVTDMSTFRVQFSQPLDRSSIDYGNTVKLATSAGVTVPAHVLVSGSYLTVDPKADLNPSQQYTLTVTTDVRSASGNALPSNYTLTFTPADTTSPTTGDRSVLIQDVADTGESPLTGAPINLIPMASVLLGEETATQSRGVIGAELAHAPNFPDITPLRIPRGMLLRGEAIDVLIGGSVDAGPTLEDSGEVTITFLSDATGYMIENPYSNSESAPRLIHLYMDVGVSTDRPAANGAITQTIQHIELVGTAFFEGDALEVNAVGMVEPLVLGSESAQGLLAFYMKAFDNQDTAPPVEQDVAALELQSWSIDSTNAHLAGPGDPIIANFNKPIDPETVAGNVTVTVGGVVDSNASVVVDGAAIVIRPSTPVDYSPENNRTVYEVTLNQDIADVNGNTLVMGVTNQFELQVLPEEKEVVRSANNPFLDPLVDHAPFILATQPGYPCVIDESTMNLADGIAGRCAGGNPGTPGPDETDYPGAHKPANDPGDDLLPVTTLPANRPISIAFSEKIDAGSVVAGETFVVERRADHDVTWTPVPGRIETTGRDLRFYPDSAWEEGALYRYTLVSAGYQLRSEQVSNYPVGQDHFVLHDDYTCDGSDDTKTFVVCGEDGLPVQTQVLGHRVRLELPYADDPDFSRPAKPVPVEDLRCVEPEVEGDPQSCPEAANFGQFADWYRTWGVLGFGTRDDAGGPPMVQHFYGGAATENVLQALRTSPETDVNANLVWDRSINIVASDWTVRTDFLGNVTHDGPEEDRAYLFAPEVEERVGSDEPQIHDSALYSQYDPNGLKPSPNSVKLISIPAVDPRDYPATLAPDARPDFPEFSTLMLATDVNIGCGYQGTSEDPVDFRDPVRQECPDQKFAPVISALYAEVTDEKNAQGDVKVLIWPGLIAVASLDIVPAMNFQPGIPLEPMNSPVKKYSYTGPQYMRMRYAPDEFGNRTQLVEAWIRQTAEGPILEADVDLYLDAPMLGENAIGMSEAAHSLSGYPVSMQLTGEVTFLEDGRMLVEQMNTNAVEIEVNASHKSGRYVQKGYIVIPEGGSYLQYLSEPIK